MTPTMDALCHGVNSLLQLKYVVVGPVSAPCRSDSCCCSCDVAALVLLSCMVVRSCVPSTAPHWLTCCRRCRQSHPAFVSNPLAGPAPGFMSPTMDSLFHSVNSHLCVVVEHVGAPPQRYSRRHIRTWLRCSCRPAWLVAPPPPLTLLCLAPASVFISDSRISKVCRFVVRRAPDSVTRRLRVLCSSERGPCGNELR
jgi:hypothetical protein